MSERDTGDYPTAEVNNAPNTDLEEVTSPPTGTGLTDLVSQIDFYSRPINEFWRKRDSGVVGAPRNPLAIGEETELKKLIQPRNQLIIDLLIARNANDWSNVLVILNKGIQGVEGFTEKIHPFSDNGITIYAPSNRNPDSDFTIKVKLSGLKRKGVVDDSLDAEELLGEKTQALETPKDFMFRTQRELAYISGLRYYASQQISDQQTVRVIDYLDQLTADIITGRLVELKRRGKIPPDFGVSFHLLSDKETHEPKFETTKISLPNGSARTFMIPGQRTGTSLASFGFDYDNEREELR